MIESSIDIINTAIARFNPSKVFALFSGGHDSLCASYIASQAHKFDGCVHINTGIGIEETREFVRKTCRKYGWNLQELHPPHLTYEDIVLKWGFPGPAGHSLVYRYLKERALRQLIKSSKTHRFDKILLVTGVRSQESSRRMGNVQEVQVEGAKVWCAPIFNWTARDKNIFIIKNSIERNEVVDMLHMSGECLCGAFAKPGELEQLEEWYPAAAKEIKRLEVLAKNANLPCDWGKRPPSGKPPQASKMGLCWSCPGKSESAHD